VSGLFLPAGDVHSDFQADYKVSSLHRNPNLTSTQPIPFPPPFLRSVSYQSAGADSATSGPPVEPDHTNWRRTDHQFTYNLDCKATIVRQKPRLFATKKKQIATTRYLKHQTSSTPVCETNDIRKNSSGVDNYGRIDQSEYLVSGPQSRQVNDGRFSEIRQSAPGDGAPVSKSSLRRSNFDSSFLPSVPLFHQVPNGISNYSGEQRHAQSRRENRRKNSLSDSGGHSSSGSSGQSNMNYEGNDDTPGHYDHSDRFNLYDQRLRSSPTGDPYYGYDGSDIVPSAENHPVCKLDNFILY